TTLLTGDLAGGSGEEWEETGEVNLARCNLIDDCIIDRATVVRACVVVKVVLEQATKLDQVIAVQPGHVIANHLVLPVPYRLTNALIVYVIGDDRAVRVASGFRRRGRARWRNFECTTQTCKLRS